MDSLNLTTLDILNFVNYELKAIGIPRQVQNVSGFFFSLHRECIEKNINPEIFKNVSYLYSPFSLSIFENFDYSNLYLTIENNAKIVMDDNEIIFLSQEKHDFFKSLMSDWINEDFTKEDYTEYFYQTFEIFLFKYGLVNKLKESSTNLSWFTFNNDQIRTLMADSEIEIDSVILEKNELEIPDYIEDLFPNNSFQYASLAGIAVISWLMYMFIPLVYLLLYFGITSAVCTAILLMRTKSKEGLEIKKKYALFNAAYSICVCLVIGQYAIITLSVVWTTYCIFKGVLTKGFVERNPFN